MGGVIKGDMTINWKGYIRVKDHANKWEVKISFGKDLDSVYKKRKMLLDDISGCIRDMNGKDIGHITGSWLSHLNIDDK